MVEIGGIKIDVPLALAPMALPVEPAAQAKPDQPKPSNTGGNLGWSHSDKTESTTTSVEAGGNVRIKGAEVIDQQSRINGQYVVIDGKRVWVKKTDKQSMSGLEFNGGMQTK